MFQTLNVKGVPVECYVVDLTEDPTSLLPITNDSGPGVQPYAEALDTAIRMGIVTKPGKYGINITRSGEKFNIFTIEE